MPCLSARGPLEKQEPHRDRREEHDLAEGHGPRIRACFGGTENRGREDRVDIRERRVREQHHGREGEEPGLFTAELDDSGRAVVNANAEIMKKYPTWVVTIEGHCDERGTAEYNLALGERRAVAVKTYLVSLGISPDRLRTVSYGKEFPFDPGHDDAAWGKNRRAHFVITSK